MIDYGKMLVILCVFLALIFLARFFFGDRFTRVRLRNFELVKDILDSQSFVLRGNGANHGLSWYGIQSFCWNIFGKRIHPKVLGKILQELCEEERFAFVPSSAEDKRKAFTPEGRGFYWRIPPKARVKIVDVLRQGGEK